MNPIRQRLAASLIITLMALLVLGCATSYTTVPDLSSTPAQTTAVPDRFVSPNPAYANAQATKDAGQRQLSDLSRKSTELSLTESQATNVAALSTQDAIHRQKMELDYQATVVSLNITQAAATQSFLTQLTKTSRDATAAAQSSAATATHSAYLINVTQTAQAQAAQDSLVQQTARAAASQTAYPMTATYSAHAINETETVQAQVLLKGQATRTAQAVATLTAYPMTATPFAVTQAALLMQEYDQEQKSFVNQIVTPLIPILAVLDLVLFILIIIRALRRFLPMPWSPYLQIARGNGNPRSNLIIDGVISNPHPQLQQAIPTRPLPFSSPGPAVENMVKVEIMDAYEPPVAHWIAEVEQQLAGEGGLRG